MAANTIDNLVEYDRYGDTAALPGYLLVRLEGRPDLDLQAAPGRQVVHGRRQGCGEVTARDWVDSAKYILTKANASQTADVLTGVLKNSDKYSRASSRTSAKWA